MRNVDLEFSWAFSSSHLGFFIFIEWQRWQGFVTVQSAKTPSPIRHIHRKPTLSFYSLAFDPVVLIRAVHTSRVETRRSGLCVTGEQTIFMDRSGCENRQGFQFQPLRRYCVIADNRDPTRHCPFVLLWLAGIPAEKECVAREQLLFV